MILFWRLHWLWCYCVLHSNVMIWAVGEEETTSPYKKVLSETPRESMKFSNPKYSAILRDTPMGDSRRLGLDIVKKSNDHLEKKTAPNNSLNRALPSAAETEAISSTTESVEQPKLDLDDFNASRNARDLTYDTIAGSGTTAQGNNSAKGVTLKNDTVYLTSTATPAAASDNTSTAINTTASVTNSSSDNNSSLSAGSAGSINKSIVSKGGSNLSTSTVSTATAMLKNPKDNENKTKIDSNSTFAKKFTINVKVKNATSDSTAPADKSPKISNVLVVNETHLENSTDYINDQWNLNETSHNYNVTEDNSKNITLLTGLAEEDFNNNETKISSTSRRTMPESPPLSTLNIALITVAAFAVVSTISIIGMVSVMLYRRYHWNKPQTLSDKCSNADSTGYIDDSTLKENSEEMYSLDNDSFLNSLEAMTIQNYWAGSIRHTKL